MRWGIGTVLVCAIAPSVQIGGLRADVAEVRADLRADIAEIRTDVRELRTDISRLDDRLRAVEIAFGKVARRLSTLERLNLPSPAEEDAVITPAFAAVGGRP